MVALNPTTERERTYSKSSKREREDVLKIQQQREKEVFKIQQEREETVEPSVGDIVYERWWFNAG